MNTGLADQTVYAPSRHKLKLPFKQMTQTDSTTLPVTAWQIHIAQTQLGNIKSDYIRCNVNVLVLKQLLSLATVPVQ